MGQQDPNPFELLNSGPRAGFSPRALAGSLGDLLLHIGLSSFTAFAAFGGGGSGNDRD